MRFITFILLYTSFSLIYGQTPNIERIDDAVVLVNIYDYNNKYLGHGSGFIIDSKGTVVTNYHVIQNAYLIKITTEVNGIKSTYGISEISKADKQRDIAILKIDNTTNKKFRYLNIAKSPPKKGENCWAIGTPADPKFMNTVSEGLVSNIRFNENPKIIQTNAEITHGSSGGALINSAGEVIGITSWGLGTKDGARASINFAIWINEINNLKIVHKKRIPNERVIPGKVCFYSTDRIWDQPRIYVDGILIGTLYKSFSSRPKCGISGTLTRALSPGIHYYYIYYPKSKSYINSKVYVSGGSCQQLNIGQPKYRKQQNSRRTNSGVENILNKTFMTQEYFGKRVYNWSVFANLSGSAPYSEYSFDGFPILSYGIEKFVGEEVSLSLRYQKLQPYTSELPSESPNIIRQEREYDYTAFFLECRLWLYKTKKEWWYIAPAYSEVHAKKIITNIHNDPNAQETPQEWTTSGMGFNLKIAYNRLIRNRWIISYDCIYSKYQDQILDRARYKNWDIPYDAAGLNFNVGLAYILVK